MKKNQFWGAIKEFALNTYLKRKVGLEYTMQFDKDFEKYVDKNYRVNQYKENGDLYMTANEKYFHLIGFIDALSWLTNQGLVDMHKIQNAIKGTVEIGDNGQSYDGLTSRENFISGAECVNTLYWYELIGSDAWD